MEQLTDMPFCQTTSWRRFFSLSDRSKRPKKSSPPARTARHEDGDETNSESACSKARSVNVGLTVASEDGTSPRQLLAHSLRPKEWVVRVVKLKGDRAQVWRSGTTYSSNSQTGSGQGPECASVYIPANSEPPAICVSTTLVKSSS